MSSWTNQATATPTPYPMAAVIPATIPWISEPLGSSEGVNELKPNSRAPVIPLQV